MKQIMQLVNNHVVDVVQDAVSDTPQKSVVSGKVSLGRTQMARKASVFK